MGFMDPDTFQRSVEKAMGKIPMELRDHMKNVGIIVQDFPEQEVLDSLGIGSPYELLGLYSGAPINHRSFFSPMLLPDQIYLYRVPILRASGPHREVHSVIYDVLLHEIGHHFGFDEEELMAMEEDKI